MPENANTSSFMMDPRPVADGAAFSNVDAVPSDGFFSPMSFKGDDDALWLEGWS